MYSGTANWDEIAAVKAALEIPVIGNGDLWSGEDARKMHAHTGCDGLMIARGSHGQPWLFGQARAALAGQPVPDDPAPEERFRIVIEHARLALAWETDEQKAMVEFRKHLGWYTKGLPNGKHLRQELFGVTRLAEVERLLEGYLAEYQGAAA
jgi:tRNA-dihydrouridine synthase B